MIDTATRDDVLWLSGLLEGEGSFDLHRGRYPRVRVGMADRDVVGRAATLMGVGVRLSIRPRPYKALWHAEVSGRKAVAVMRAVLPHMGARRSARIAECLGHATTNNRRDPVPVHRPPGLLRAV